MQSRLDREQIVNLLTDLGSELAERGVRADLFLVGGAAIALAFNTRRATRDVDGVFEPKARGIRVCGSSRGTSRTTSGLVERCGRRPATWA